MWGMARTRDKVVLYRCFATLFASGVHILACLTTLALQSETPALGAALTRVQQKVLQGSRLAQALQSESEIFGDFEVRCLAAGERGGFLHASLAALAEYFEEQQQLQQQLVRDLVYPLGVVACSLLMVATFPPFLQRALGPMLDQVGQLPWLTRLLSTLSQGLGSPFTWGLMVLFLGLVLGLWSRLAHEHRDRWLLRLPLWGGLRLELLRLRFLQTLRLSLEAGLPLLEALQVAGAATASPAFQARVREVGQRIREGETLAVSLGESELLSPWLSGFLEAGEQSGRLPVLLHRASHLLQQNWHSRVELALQLLQPMVLALLGGLVGLIALGALLPMGQLLESL